VHHELIIAGFGGQGVILAGHLLALAGMLEGRHVVWNPSYGPEMRGGSSHCTVIISSEPVGSPVVAQPDSALILDAPSLGKFEGQVRPGGLLVVNSSLVRNGPSRTDVRVVAIPANHLAEEVGEARIANMVMLGAFLALEPVVPVARIVESLREVLPPHRHKLIPLNEKALAVGAECAAAAKR